MKKSTIYISTFIAILIFWLITTYFLSKFLDVSGRRELYGGDTFSAVTSLFSGLAFGGIIVTVLMQRDELKLQRRELKLQRKEMKETRGEFVEQNRNLVMQRQDNTFFNMISIHHRLLESLVTHTGNTTGRFVFQAFLNLWAGDLHKQNIIEFEAKHLKDYQTTFRLKTVGMLGDTIMPYLQSLSSLFEFIALNEALTENEREKYYKILKSYISFLERRYLFYFVILGMTSDGVHSALKIAEKTLKLLGTVPSNQLLHPSHVDLLKTFE